MSRIVKRKKQRAIHEYNTLSKSEYAQAQLSVRVFHQKSLTPNEIAKRTGEHIEFVNVVLSNLHMKPNPPEMRQPKAHCWSKRVKIHG